MRMNNMFFVLVVCGFGSLAKAMIVTKYERTPTTDNLDVFPCGVNAYPLNYCAARVTNDTCEPLTRDWCETQDMSLGGSYLIKQTIKYIPENTFMLSYNKPVPIYMSVGSEVEMKFVGRTNWTIFRCNLRDVNNNFVLHLNVRSDKIYMFWKNYAPGNVMQDYNPIQPLYHYPDVEYTLTIRCDVNSFQIYRNGIFIWTYNTGLPITSITNIYAGFLDMDGDIYYMAFKAGQ